ncbi:MAG: tRNA 2-thiouridine(34) synthase MnmA [Commensalibacter sp.]|nr:tRNA 2-thiouridine(34) synthase MnmA [Commensalibacter sp.]
MRIVVAMSGGVDSSVTAALLKEQGHEVIGATLQLYDARGVVKKGSCCAGKDIRDARRVADRLNIPHYVIDAEQRFHQTVIDRFAEAYTRGETPVPCIACNQGVKFTDLLNMAKQLGAEAMATGHYVRRIEGPHGVELHRPVDMSRDQSWFLFATTAEQLAYLRFPLGDMPNKDAVRKEAERFGLTVAQKADSQDICFVTDKSYIQIVEKLAPEGIQPGEIVDEQGTILGQHEGIAHYTIGQSKRLGNLAMRNGERQMVVRIDPSKKRIIIGPRQKAGKQEFFLRDVNWLIPEPVGNLNCTVQIRAREVEREATVSVTDQHCAKVVLKDQASPAPGQACVFYRGSQILGGGFIQS